MDGKLNSILTEAFLTLLSEHPAAKERFFEFKNYSAAAEEEIKQQKNTLGKWFERNFLEARRS